MTKLLTTVLLFGGQAAQLPEGQEQTFMQKYSPILMIVGIIVVFYFLFWRPQASARKKEKAFADNLSKGDKVITGTGFYGKIVEINDGNVVLEIATGVKIKVLKSAIVSYQDGTKEPKESDTKKQKEDKNDESHNNDAIIEEK